MILITNSGFSQTFLDAFKKYKLEGADTISNPKTRQKIKKYIKSQCIELDTVFKSYNTKTNFDFNTADTLFLIFDSPAESPFTSDIIIWSGIDTISYRQGFETIEPYKNKRTITYQSFFPKVVKPKGYMVVTERDSIIGLVSKRDYTTLNHLGDNQIINDGNYISIYISYKQRGKYIFESSFPKQFIIPDVYRKE